MFVHDGADSMPISHVSPYEAHALFVLFSNNNKKKLYIYSVQAWCIGDSLWDQSVTCRTSSG
jgi:hypothetical protein